jgi:hypothetical protein
MSDKEKFNPFEDENEGEPAALSPSARLELGEETLLTEGMLSIF